MVEEVSNTEITINVSDIRYEDDNYYYYDYEDNINDCSGCDCDDDMIPLTTASRMVYSENREVEETRGGGILVDGREKGNNDNNNDMNIVDNNINDSYNDDDDACSDANNNNVYDNYDELHSNIDEDEHREKEDEYFTTESGSDNNDNAGESPASVTEAGDSVANAPS